MIEELGTITEEELKSIEISKNNYEIDWKNESEKAKHAAKNTRDILRVLAGFFFFLFFVGQLHVVLLILSFILMVYSFYDKNTRDLLRVLAGFFFILFFVGQLNVVFLILSFIVMVCSFYYDNIWCNGIPHENMSMGQLNQLKIQKDIKRGNYQKGKDGEVKVEYELLSKFSDDFILINDITLKNCKGNIDHLVVGPNGIFVIETKSWSTKCDIRRFPGELCVVNKDGDNIGNYKNPVLQATKNANCMNEELHNLGIQWNVISVVVFVGLSGRIYYDEPDDYQDYDLYKGYEFACKIEELALKIAQFPAGISRHGESYDPNCDPQYACHFDSTNYGFNEVTKKVINDELFPEDMSKIVKHFEINYDFKESKKIVPYIDIG